MAACVFATPSPAAANLQQNNARQSTVPNDAQAFTVFDRTFTREKGQPAPVVVPITIASPGSFKLRIESSGAASAVVLLNGATVAGPSDFSGNPRAFERTVSLGQSNSLSVEVRGAPGGTIRVTIIGHDRDHPVVSANVAPPPNSSGWNNAAVTISFECSDRGSGIATCSSPVSLTAEGANQPVSATAIDRVGNATTITVVVNIDRTAPSISGAINPPPNALGWNNTDVQVAFTCIDALSGIAECTQPVALPAQNQGTQKIAGIARDHAGNSASAAVVVNIDNTPPTVVATPERPPDADGWYLAPVIVSFACADDRSGVVVCPEPVRVVSVGAGIEVPGISSDRAGNVARTTFVLNMRPADPPGLSAALTPLPNGAGWNNGDVTVTFTCTDSGSGVASCPAPITVSAEGVHEISATALDPFGTSRTIALTVRLDRTPPTIIAAASEPPNAAGWHRTPVTVQFTCTDSLSGVAACPAPVVTAVDGAGQVVTGTAIDDAGNSAVSSTTINLDTTPPQIRAIVSDPDLIANGDVTVSFECSDALSGIASCPQPVTIAAEGANQTATGITRDNAGNEAAVSVSVTLDRTLPTIVATVSPSANGAGWHNTPVTVTFTCSDTGSTVASCPEPATIATEGANQVVSGEAVDAAGNRSTASITVNLDTTAPVISLSPSTPANAEGWHNAPVTVGADCHDQLSGVATCSSPQQVATDGDHRLILTATDVAGNTASAALEIRLDTTPPSIGTAITPPANGNGWHNTDVSIVFECADAGSGVAECPPARVVQQEGSGQVVSASVIDRAGNVASISSTVNLDRTPPVIAASPVPPPNQDGWNNTAVTITFSCSDPLSELASCSPPVVVDREVMGETVPGVAIDRAGNRADASVTLNIDMTAPTVQPRSSAAGWTNTNVNVTFECTDVGAGVQFCSDPQVVSQEGQSSVAGQVTDRAGNTSTSSIEVNIDRTPPTIVASIEPPLLGGFTRQPVTVSFVCTDTASGVIDCPAPRLVDTEGLDQIISGTARDAAGNTAEASVSVSLDLTPPNIRAVLVPEANANGWNNTPVTVTFVCEDALGPVLGCPAPVTVSTEGAGQVVSAEVTDAAGHRAAVTTTLNLDFTPPQISAIVTPPANAQGWHGVPVTVSFTCGDALAEIGTCPSPVTVQGGAGQVIIGTALDRAGNAATASVTLNVDLQAPVVSATITPQPNAAGWNSGDVTVSFECSDSGAGIVECPTPFSVTAEGGNQLFQRTVVDGAGNSSVITTRVSIDRTPPTIAFTGPAENVVVRSTPVQVTATLADALSGVATMFCGSTQLPGAATLNCQRELAPGANTILVRAIDAAGNEASLTRSVQYEPNRAPRAMPGGPYNGTTGTPVVMSGGASFDPDNDTLTYSWRFGDNTTGTGAQPSHVYATAGTFSITLTVDDGNGGVHEATATATIVRANTAPTASLGATHATDVDVALMFDASASTDSDGDTLTATWAFGDGGIGTGMTPRYAYRAAGTYTATVTINDGRGGTATASTQVNVRPANRVPAASAGGPYRGEIGTPIVFTAAASSDPDADPLGYQWTFGNGGTASGMSPSHTFTEPGVFPVTVTVTDARGGTAAASTQVTVTAANTPPIAEANGPYTQEVGFPIAFTSAGSTDADNDVLTFTWRFGDGRVNTGPSPSSAYATAGTYTVELSVDDGRGGVAVDTATVIVTPRPTEENRNPVASAGGPYQAEAGLPIPLNPDGSLDPDGDALSYAWVFGDGGTSTERAPQYAWAEAGVFTVTLTISDGRGGSAASNATVTVSAASDRAPPRVTLLGPAQVLPGTEVSVLAQVADASAIAEVSFEIEDGDVTADTEPPFERIVTIPAVAAPGATLRLRATATDAAGNAGSGELVMTISAQPDGEPPSISMTGPAQAAPGSVARFTATATDVSGVKEVIFLVGDQQIGIDRDPPFETAYAVPADAQVGSAVRIAARAADYTGNEAEFGLDLIIGATPDIEPPTISLSVPPTTNPGASVAVVATPNDDHGIAKVQFRIEGVAAAEITSAPFRIEVPVDAAAPPGALVRIEATAVDFAGLEASAAATVRVTSPLTSGEGLITGEVYDDTLGVPLSGARVRFAGVAEGGAPIVIDTETDLRGTYVLGVPAGAGSITVTREGWTSAMRPVIVRAGLVVVPMDARLTPQAPPQTVSPVLGATVQAGPIQLRIGPGAVAFPVAVRARRLSAQGLTALLPIGWSPIDAIDIAPANLILAGGIELEVPLPIGIAPERSVTLARWDADAAAWRALSSQPAGEGTIVMPITEGGQYAWVIGDLLPAAPPTAAAGGLLLAAQDTPLPGDALANLTPQPRVLIYEPGARSEVATEVPSAQSLPSGTRLEATIAETYHLVNGGIVRPDAMVQDVIFHQQPSSATRLRATYPVSASAAFESLALREGIITIDVHAPAGAGDLIAVGAAGGTVEGDGGVTLTIPSNGVAVLTSATLQPLTADALGLALPPGVTFVGGASVALSGGLDRAGSLSIARPEGVADGDTLLLVRVAESGGASRMVLAALGRADGDRVNTVLQLPRNGIALEGVRHAGRYAFVKIDEVAFAFGQVMSVSGAPFAGALITSDTLTIAAIADASGRYVSAIRPLSTRVVATDVARNDSGSIVVTPSGRGDELAADLRLVTDAPRITSVSPANGAVNVPPTVAITVRFSEPIDPASIGGGSVLTVDGPNGSVGGALALSDGNMLLTFRSAVELSTDTEYTVRVAGVRDMSGNALAAPLVTRFTSLDTTAPPPPPAGALRASIPEDGSTTVTASQGTAGAHDTVFVENVTRGQLTPVLVDANGGFVVRVTVGLRDKLRLRITDRGGNETVVDLPRFSDGAGRVVVGPDGGTIDGPDGLQLEVAPGTFPQGSIVRFVSQSAAQLGASATPDFPFVAGFAVESSAPPQNYMNVSMPVPPGTPEGDAGIIAEVVEVFGVQALSIVDSAIVVNGRLRTSSPPCPGILTGKFTRYGAYLTPWGQRQLAVSLLNLAVPRTANVVVQPMMVRPNPFLPVPTVLYPGLEFGERVFPQGPFINRILSGHQTAEEVFASLEGGVLMPNGEVCDVVTQACAPSRVQACMVVPADTPMTVVVRNATTGAVINAVPVTSPSGGGVGNVTQLYVAPGDTQGPGLVGASWGPTPPFMVDPNEPIELRFSEGVTFTGVPSGQPIFLQELGTNRTIEFARILISERSRKLTLTPAGTLLMGRSYRIMTPGLTDLAGNPFTGTPEFQTFVPTVVEHVNGFLFRKSNVDFDLNLNMSGTYVASSLTSVGLRDVSFSTTSPENSVDGRWHTTVTGVKGGFDISYKLFTFNLDAPNDPRALSGVVFGNRSGLTTVTLPALRMTPRVSAFAPGPPVSDALDSWRDRRLYIVADNPALRICGDPSDAAITAWVQRQTAAGRLVNDFAGCGDLALVTSYNTLFGMVDMYDVTDRTRPIQIGHRIWNDNTASMDPPPPRRRWAPQGAAVPKNIAVLPGLDITHDQNGVTDVNQDTIGIYGALNMLGLGMVDLQRNVPPIADFQERLASQPGATLVESEAAWIFPYYHDVDVLRSKVIAIANDRTDGSGTAHLEVFTPNLQPIGPPFPMVGMMPESLWVREDFLSYDANGDGVPEPHDAAIVTGAQGGVAVVQIDDAGAPALLGFIRTSRTTPPPAGFASGLGDLRIEWLGHIDVDVDQKVAYVKARWLPSGSLSSTQGLLAINLSRPFGGPVDADGDGWDDRLLGLVPLIGPGLSYQQGEVNKFRIDQERKLIYVAVETVPDDVPFMVVRMCQCSDLLAKVDLRSAGINAADFPSGDGLITTVFATAADYATGQVRVAVDTLPYTGSTVSYTVTEVPFTGNAGDRILEPSWSATGSVSAGPAVITLPLAPRPPNQPLPPGSLIAIDFRDSSGNHIKRLNVEVVTLHVAAPNVVVRTRLDKTNGRILEQPSHLNFYLPVEGRVTVQVDGTVLTRDVSGAAIPPFADIAMPAGWNQIAIGRQQVPEPGTHSFLITATFEAGVTAVTPGTILHDVEITESLPIGHTFIKGVDLQDGHLALSRDDVAIAGVGPPLSFARSYSSTGVKSSGPMGANWSHNWQSSLSVDAFGTVTVSAGDGGGGRFTQTASGSQNVIRFRPDPGYHGVVEFTNGAYDYYSKARWRYHFEKPVSDPNADYLLQWVEDSNANRLTLTYANGTQLERVTDAAGRTLTFSYEDHGQSPEPRVVRVEGPLGLQVSFTYDQFGNLESATRGPRSEQYSYSVNHATDKHNLVTVTDPNGNVTRYGYFEQTDAFPGETTPPFDLARDVLVIPQKYELVKTVTEGDGSADEATTIFQFDYSNHQTRYLTSVTDGRGTTTQYTLNPRGNVIEQRTPTPAGDNVTTMRWAYEDGINDVYMTRRTDPNGRVVRYEYDANGNLTRETVDTSTVPDYAPVRNGAGVAQTNVVTQYTYDQVFNRVLSKTDPEGNVTTYTYDPNTGDLLTTATDPLDGSTPHEISYTYVDHTTPSGAVLRGLLSRVRDPLNRETRYEGFDQWGHATRTVDPLGNITTNTFDERGRVTSSTDTMGRHVTTAYDALDQVLSITKLAGVQPAAGPPSADRVERFTYFPGGQRETATDGEDHVTTYAYDALNRLVRESIDVTDAAGSTSTLEASFTYDGNGNRASETDRRGITRTLSYDVLNRLQSVTVAGVGVVSSYTYDATGNRVSETDLHGHRTEYELDGLYRVARTVLPQAPYTLRATYDLVGNVLESFNANGDRHAKTYDGEYRLRSETSVLGVVTNYTYDAVGNRLTVENAANGLLITSTYDDLNRPLTVTSRFTDPVSGQVITIPTSRNYDDASHSVQITDGRGSVMRERYNGHDALIERTLDPGGLALTTSMRYDGNGRTTHITDPQNGDVDVETQYDALGRAIRVTRPLRGSALSFFDGNGNIVRTVDGRGIVHRYAYDLLDRRTDHILEESISNGGADLTLSHIDYDDGANLTHELDAGGARTEIHRDALHREVLVIDDAGNTTVKQWDGIERRVEIDRRGIRTEYDYDAAGRQTATRDFGGPALTGTVSAYDDAAGTRIDTDRRGIQTITTFDALGRVRRVARRHPSLTAEYGSETVTLEERVYDGAGLVTERRDARGSVETHGYDAAGRKTTTTVGFGTPDASTTTLTYDAAGNVLTMKDGRSHGGAFDVRYAYDEAYRRRTETNGAGETTAYDYDAADEVIRITQPMGLPFVTQYSYDELGRLLTVDETRGGTGGITRTAYDERRNRIAVADASGRLTTYRYDSLGRLTDEFRHVGASPLPTGRNGDLGPGAVNDARHTHYGYDAEGNQTLIVDPAGQRVARTYDYLGRLETKTYSNHVAGPDGAVVYPQPLRTVYEYDLNGNPIAIAETKRFSESSGDVVETVTSEYDHLERLVTQTNPDGKTVRTRFNAAGDRVAETDPDGVITTSAFDALGRVRQVTSGGGVTVFEYHADGLQRQVTFPNGVVSTMSYDAADRMTEVRNESGSGVLVSRQAYTYDANGNRLTASEQHGSAPAETMTYAYDRLNRLASVSYGAAGSVAYTYDATGNRLTESGTAAGAAIDRRYTYDGLAQLLHVEDVSNTNQSLAFTYDRNGNTTRRVTGILQNGVIAAPASSQLFTFDLRDRLVRADARSGIGPVSFDYDVSGRRTKMFSALFDIRFAYGQTDVIQEYSGSSGAATQRYTLGNGLLAVGTPQAGGGLANSYYLTDALKSATNLVDGAGAVVQSTSYDAWGSVRARTGTSANRRAFTGHYEDAETGLLYMGARYYDPAIGRFLSRDMAPAVQTDPISASKYLYAHANPLTYVDPTGNAAEPAQPPQTDEPDLSQASTGQLIGHWLLGIGKGAIKALGTPIAGLLRSAVLGLADVGQAGIGYLAISANPQYVDEIGALLTPVSDIGKKAAEQGTLAAVKESGTGFVKETVTSVVTMPSRMKAAVVSGDPEQLGAAAVEAVQVASSLKGPAAVVVRKVDQSMITLDILSRQRISKMGDPAGRMAMFENLRGTVTVKDAWAIAGACVQKGVTGCSFVGGLSERSISHLVDNLRARQTLGRGPLERKVVNAIDEQTGLATREVVSKKYHGDLDMIVNKPGKPYMTDWETALAVNNKTSVPLLDTTRKHGVLGEFMPEAFIPIDARRLWWQQQNLAVGSPIRAFDYWSKGVKGWPGKDVAVAPLLKNGAGDTILRKVSPDNFEYRTWSGHYMGDPALHAIDWTRLTMIENYREQPKK